MISRPFIIEDITKQWGLRFKRLRPDCDIQGSPERTLFRTVFEDVTGDCFLLEQIAPHQHQSKLLIINTIESLRLHGLGAINPYIKTPAGNFLPSHQDSFWQLSRFLKGTPLKRPDYLADGPKGRALATFLINLYDIAPRSGINQSHFKKFSLTEYILRIKHDLSIHDALILKRVNPVFDFLSETFMDAYESLPLCLCHGDYHPLNIIWNNHETLAVIDWEFMAIKPDIYDVANLVGCLGMEHPQGLNNDLALNFIDIMKKEAALSPKSWGLLVEFIVALRFAWLAEWLRKKDTEMIELEVAYMTILINNIDQLNNIWGI